jgi:hypothetical protein
VAPAREQALGDQGAPGLDELAEAGASLSWAEERDRSIVITTSEVEHEGS